jgi:hypothetical protein
MKPGIYEVGAEAYHADPCETPSLSASLANVLLNQSPAHARAQHPRLNPVYERKSDEKFDVGTVAHSLLLEGLSVMDVHMFPDWRTGAAKEARELSRAHGRIPLLVKQADEVTAMVDAVATQIAQLDVNPLPLVAGKPEQTMVWQENGVHCRARIDWLHDDLTAIDDVKTTSRSANPESWSRTLFGIGCDVQAAFYLRGIRALTGAAPEWRWLVVETSPPYALSVVAPGPDVLALADAKVDRALALWRGCLETDTWPAYPTRVCYAELPPWEEQRFLAREDAQAA